MLLFFRRGVGVLYMKSLGLIVKPTFMSSTRFMLLLSNFDRPSHCLLRKRHKGYEVK